MYTKEIKDNSIELIYAYFESLNDEKEKKSFKNFEINFTSRFKVTYDFWQGSLKIDRNIQEDTGDFWNVGQTESNIMDMTLVLGENGVGKTTLLRAIAACGTEVIESTIKNYILLYYIQETDCYFIKTTCRELVDVSDIAGTSGGNEFKNLIYEGKRGDKDVFGFYGIAELNGQGKVVPSGRTEYIKTLSEVKVSWAEILPMDCLYLPVVSDKNSGRFIERKKLLHLVDDVRNLDILKFLLLDHKNAEGSFLKEYPKVMIRSTSVKQTQNAANFHDYSLQLFKAIQMGNERPEKRRKGKFLVNGDEYYKNSNSNKKIFFSCVLVYFITRLCVDLERKHNSSDVYRNIKKMLEKIEAQGSCPPIRNVYRTLCTIINDILGSFVEKEAIARFKKVLACIERLPEEYFTQDNTDINLRYATCQLTVDCIAQNNKEAFIEFMEAVYELERVLQTDKDTFSFMDLEIGEMSTGEYSLVRDIFARIQILKDQIKKPQEKKSILLIMDEPDIGLHLRWIQKLIYTLIETLKRLYPDNKFQIILTSHMPFMVTDFPRSSVICLCDLEWRKAHADDQLDWNDGYGSDVEGIRGFHPENGFMCNYYDILRDAFFIDIPVGEFAQAKFRKLSSELNKSQDMLPEKEIEKLQKQINMIDEKLLRKMLQEKLYKRKSPQRQISELNEQIKILQEQVQKLTSEIK